MTPKIPKGWRKLRVGRRVRVGDKEQFYGSFIFIQSNGDLETPVKAGEVIIRRIAKKGRK